MFKDATAVVTGAGSGIGRALSLELARRGARVFVTDVDGESAKSVATSCGSSASARRVDVRNADEVRDVIEEAAALGRLDYLFNNAGIGVGGEVQDLSFAHWERVIDVNLRGVLHGVTAAYPIMVRQKSGHIVNTASLAGLGPAPFLTPYATTKHAVVGLSTSLRVEAVALGVRVSVLCPGVIETPLLDSRGPADLPALPWTPDARRFLTKVAGAPYPVDKLAREALDEVERNRAVIVLPARARMLWRLGRVFPGAAEKSGGKAVAAARASRGT